jgi:hypothetical protein
VFLNERYVEEEEEEEWSKYGTVLSFDVSATWRRSSGASLY